MLAGRPLKIVTLGSSSTAGAGASAARFSYPSRLAVELAQRRPAATVEIVNRGINGEDAWENLKRLESDVIDAKPDLVIWQFGTNAVIHDVDYEEYGRLVQGGIDRLRAARIEVLLIDLQYAPRVTEVPDHQRMLDFFDAIGARNHVAVFHRYAGDEVLGRRDARRLRDDAVVRRPAPERHELRLHGRAPRRRDRR